MWYAPKSARMSAWNAVIEPSFFTPIRTLAIWSRPWWQTCMFSERVSIHLTGRSSLRAAQQSRTSSPYICSLEPKPPPTSGATARTRSWPMPRRIPRNRRTKCGTWVLVQIVSSSPR